MATYEKGFPSSHHTPASSSGRDGWRVAIIRSRRVSSMRVHVGHGTASRAACRATRRAGGRRGRTAEGGGPGGRSAQSATAGATYSVSCAATKRPAAAATTSGRSSAIPSACQKEATRQGGVRGGGHDPSPAGETRGGGRDGEADDGGEEDGREPVRRVAEAVPEHGADAGASADEEREAAGRRAAAQPRGRRGPGAHLAEEGGDECQRRQKETGGARISRGQVGARHDEPRRGRLRSRLRSGSSCASGEAVIATKWAGGPRHHHRDRRSRCARSGTRGRAPPRQRWRSRRG